jgi:hypothetical protein
MNCPRLEQRADSASNAGDVAGRKRIVRAFIWSAMAVTSVLMLYALALNRGTAMAQTPRDAYYNRLVDGFRHGQLHLARNVPTGLLQLSDPLNPDANQRFRQPGDPATVHDLSLYRGRLYLYFGVTPALLLFWPCVALTGHWLSHAAAVLLLMAVGFGTYAWLLFDCWRRYFVQVPIAALVTAILAVGLLPNSLLLLQRPEVWEVTVACEFALIAVALALLWRAVVVDSRAVVSIALASVAYGLAIGARPSAAPGVVVLLFPVLYHARAAARAGGGRRWWRLLVAAVVPVGAIGLALWAYNVARFGHGLEFGQSFQLASDRQDSVKHFSLDYLGFNARAYFFAPANWTARFPYVSWVLFEGMPRGHGAIDPPWGLLANLPFLWLALLAPVALPTSRSDALAPWLGALAALFFVSSVTLCLFYGTTIRYQMEFAPLLAVLASVGLFAVEAMLAHRAAWLRWITRLCWVTLAVESVAMAGGFAVVVREFVLRSHGAL